MAIKCYHREILKQAGYNMPLVQVIAVPDGEMLCVDRDDPRWQELVKNRRVEQAVPVKRQTMYQCRHRGPRVSSDVACPTCNGHVVPHVYQCAVHQRCTLTMKINDETFVCGVCEDRQT